MVRFLQNLFRPSFPKAIALMALLCAAILLKYRTPEKALVKSRKAMGRPVAAAPAKVVAAPAIIKPEVVKPKVMKKRIAKAPKKAKRRKVHTVAKVRTLHIVKKEVAAPAEAARAVTHKVLGALAVAALSDPNAGLFEVTPEEGALDVVSPLGEIEVAAFNEAPQVNDNGGVEISSLELADLPVERELRAVIGEIRQNEFIEFKEQLAHQENELGNVGVLSPLPESRPQVQPAQVDPVRSPDTHPEPELVRPSRPVLSRGPSEEDSIPEPQLVVPDRLRAPEAKLAAAPAPTVTDAEPTLVAAPQEIEEEVAEPTLDANLNSMFATLGAAGGVSSQIGSMLSTSPPAQKVSQVTQPSQKPTVAPVPEKSVSEKDKNVLVVPDETRKSRDDETQKPRDIAQKPRVVPPPPKPDKGEERQKIDQRIYGRLELDNGVAKWLEANDGHIELVLHPVSNGDGQDKIPLEYQWPAQEFAIEPTGLRGTYHLIATVFTAGHSHEAAQIVHREPVSSTNHTSLVRFRVTERALRDALSSTPRASTSSGVLFSSLVYEVNTDSPKKFKIVNGGNLSIVGFPEWGRGEVQADGSLKMKLPSHSEMIAYVSAPGYYPTYQVIPTFGRDVLSHIYLVPSPRKEQIINPIDAMIRGFTGRAHDPNFAVIMGRLFDPASREPLANEPIAISHPMAADQLLPLTTQSGFYGFSNVVPSMRAISRPNGGRVALVSAIAGSAQYVDLGRGGKRALSGKLVDPFGGNSTPIGLANVRLALDEKSETVSDDDGVFRIPEIDLAPGILTLEVKAEGYPRTWHNVAWNSSERERTVALRMIPEQWIESSLEANRLPKQDKTRPTGTLVGGIHKSLFQGKDVCLYVQLLSVVGTPVSAASGPFPFGGNQASRPQPFCLTQQSPGFVYFHLPDGEYILKYLTPKKRLLKTHVVRIGKDRVTVAVE